MCKTIGNVYVLPLEVPKTIRIVSKKLNLDHIVLNDSNLNVSNEPLTYDDLVKLAENDVFDYVSFSPRTNSIYMLQPEGSVPEEERKHFFTEDDWILVRECTFIDAKY